MIWYEMQSSTERRKGRFMMKRKQMNKNNFTLLLIITMISIVATAVIGILGFNIYMKSLRDTMDRTVYNQYYVMIVENRKDAFWQAVYKGAYEAGQKENIYVELLGDNLSRDYEREDLMRIAIASEVDGIIVTADESEEMSLLIDEAAAAGIPVVTLYEDSTQSSRCSFVGVGSYDLGREYGKQVLRIAEEKVGENSHANTETTKVNNYNGIEEVLKVAVLVDANAKDSSQNILCSGIQETIDMEKIADAEIEISLITIDDTNAFSVEESIRDIFMQGDTPDIFICLNELSTTCVYQAVVDYNRVGEVNILGYYDSDTILKAIERNVIYASVSIDTMQMGGFCVDALSEYHELGYTSQYFTADIALIDKNNVSEYITGGGSYEE
jgi:ribose transport system substrate-binding protein